MKTFMVLSFIGLAWFAFAGLIYAEDAFKFISVATAILLIPFYSKIERTEDDYLFLWVKTKSKRLRERKNSAKEAMRKELEED